MLAYCWASGRIEFGRAAPVGTIVILKGPAKEIRPLVESGARHGYEPGILLVPGIPEAEVMGWDPVEKLLEFRKILKAKAAKRKEAAIS